MHYSPHQLAYFAHKLNLRAATDSMDRMAGALLDAQVDLNPHQIDAALFATSNPLSKGVILADEVGLGKTIEAGLLIAQRWAERKRHILVIVPANLRKQWHQELADKFGLSATILEAKSFRQSVKDGVANPFDAASTMGARSDRIVICSYQFAAGKADAVKSVPWDLVVVDEAHRLRNVYKPDNKTARTLLDALSHARKVLLTATPLQNSLLELYGLVSFIDDRVFGDLDSFRQQFGQLRDAGSFEALKHRISPICKRTLRRQVGEPGDDETRLYDLVSEYLRRGNLYALPNSQRQLITLVLRKLLASSTFAIAGALDTLIRRLKQTLDEKAPGGLVDELDEDYESLCETADELGTDDAEDSRKKTAQEIAAIRAEIIDLDGFRQLAVSITENAKGLALLQALKVAFERLLELGAAQKAIIFTESRRTQDYLLSLLLRTEYVDGVVLFNGSNTDPLSRRIYAEWMEQHKGSSRVSGSRSADTRAALVDYFRERGRIMIATEAGAEGINLQFCSLVINYDLPWNPQRIEQRIGRCHRYGQKHDVVVVNFLNRDNEADRRVYELLDQKFKLFEGVFGASDEVLGAVEAGVDFERRIADIYQNCRHPNEIHSAFEQLQLDLAGEISDAMLNARKVLLENFDEEVQERLKVAQTDAKASLDRLERLLMRFTRAMLDGHAVFDVDELDFTLNSVPPHIATSADADAEPVPLGRYELPRRSEEAHVYRLQHPLAQSLLRSAQRASLAPSMLYLDYAAYGSKVSVLDVLRGKEGVGAVQLLRIHSLGATEEYRLPRSAEMDGRYRNPDNHPKDPWKATPLYAKRTGSEREQAFSFTFKNGVVWTPPRGTSPRFPAETLRTMDQNHEIWFGSDGQANPSRKTFLAELKVSGPPAPTVWLHSDAGNNHEAREEVKAIDPTDSFATPKPEKLLKRVLELATLPGDLVLDSFAGSGTTGAVAQKMGRRWLMVELGEHCHTHVIPRLKKVIDGDDKGGVTEAVGGQAGGGFRYYRLAPSLLQQDRWGQWIVNKDYNAEMLAAAICKLEGFTYAPSSDLYWQHGHSTESDFIYVTTQSLNAEQLQALSEEVGSKRTLLVCCGAFRADANRYPNLTGKKIPKMVLQKCEWGHDDYSLNVENLPQAPKPAKPMAPQASLFDDSGVRE